MRRTKVWFMTAALILVTFSGWASENSVLWSNLYREADTYGRRFAVMVKISQEKNRDLIPVMLEAQTGLLKMAKDVMSPTDRYLHGELQKMVIKNLGDLKAAEAADVVYRTAVEAEDMFLKADAVRALGKIGASEYAPQTAMLLRNINIDAVVFASPEERETMALACVSALERMKVPLGFEPVFFTATGRYSRKVTQPALESLKNMIADPSPELLNIIKTNSDYRIKLKALEFAGDSQAPKIGKSAVAAECLKEGMSYAAVDAVEKNTMARLRILACSILTANGYDDPGVSSSLAGMLAYVPKETGDLNEILACLEALGAGSSEESAKALSAHLKKLNDLQVSGIKTTDQREIKAVIQALGVTGKTSGRVELTRVQFCDWNSAVNREAQAALLKLK